MAEIAIIAAMRVTECIPNKGKKHCINSQVCHHDGEKRKWKRYGKNGWKKWKLQTALGTRSPVWQALASALSCMSAIPRPPPNPTPLSCQVLHGPSPRCDINGPDMVHDAC